MFQGIGGLNEHLFGPNAQASVLIRHEVDRVADTPGSQADAAIKMIER